MASITNLPRELFEDIVWWTREICQIDDFFRDSRLVNRQFNEAVLYTIFFRSIKPATNPPRGHRDSCNICSLTQGGIDRHNPVYARMHLQARIKEGGLEMQGLRQFYCTLRAALRWLEMFLEDPESESARDLLSTDYHSTSYRPVFANRASILLCDTVVHLLETWKWDSRHLRSKHEPTCRLLQAPISFWIMLTIYNLGDLRSIERRVWSLLDTENRMEKEFGTLRLSLRIAARKGHRHVLEYATNQQPRLSDDNILYQVAKEAARAGQLECVKVAMSRTLQLHPGIIRHHSVRGPELAKQRPMTLDNAIFLITILPLDPQKRQIGARGPELDGPKSSCGDTHLNTDTSIANVTRHWAEKLIEALVKQEGWVPPQADCTVGERILELFWATVEASFLLLYQFQDGSFLTRTCREMIEGELEIYHPDPTKAVYRYIEKNIVKWRKSELQSTRKHGLKEQHSTFIFAAGYEDGLNILARQKVNDPSDWCDTICNRSIGRMDNGICTVGQCALWFAIRKLRPENVEFLLKRNIRFRDATSMEMVSWSYRRTREGEYQAVQKLLRECPKTRPVEFIIPKPEVNTKIK